MTEPQVIENLEKTSEENKNELIEVKSEEQKPKKKKSKKKHSDPTNTEEKKNDEVDNNGIEENTNGTSQENGEEKPKKKKKKKKIVKENDSTENLTTPQDTGEEESKPKKKKKKKKVILEEYNREDDKEEEIKHVVFNAEQPEKPKVVEEEVPVTRGRAYTFASFLSDLGKKQEEKAPEKHGKSVEEFEKEERIKQAELNLQNAIKTLEEDEEHGKPLAKKIIVTEEGKETRQISAKELVPEVVKFLNEYPENEKLVTGGLLVIKYIKDTSGLQYIFRESGGYESIKKLLSSANDNIRLMAIRFIGDTVFKVQAISDNIKNGEVIVQSKTLSFIIKLLNDPNQEIEKMAAGVINLLASLDQKSLEVNFIEEIFLAGGISCLIPLIEKQDILILRPAAAALKRMASAGAKYRKSLLDEKILQILLSQLKLYNLAVFADTQLVLLQIVQAIFSDPEDFPIEVNFLAEIFTVVFKSPFFNLITPPYSILKEIVLEIISTVSSKPEYSEKLKEIGAFDVAVEYLFCDEQHLQKSSASAIGSLVSDPEIRTKGYEKKVLERLLELLSSKTTFVQHRSVSALTMFAKHKDSHKSIIELNIIPKLISMMDGLESVEEEVLIFFVQCLDNEIMLEELHKSGLPSLLRLLTFKDNTLKIRENSLILLNNLMKDTKVQELFVKEKNVIATIVGLLETTRESLIVQICITICKLTETHISSVAKRTADLAVKYRAPEKLVAIISSFKEPTQELIIKAMIGITTINDKAQSSFAKAQAITQLLPFVSLDTNKSLVELSLSALNAIVHDNSSNKKKYGPKIISAVSPLLTSDNKTIQINSFKIFASLCKGSSSNQKVSEFALESIISPLKLSKLTSYKEDFHLIASIGEAITNMVSKNVQNQNALGATSFPSLLVDHINEIGRDYIEDLKIQAVTGRKETVYWLVSSLAAFALKNEKNQINLIEVGAEQALTKLVGVDEKTIKKIASKALDSLNLKKHNKITKQSKETQVEEKKVLTSETTQDQVEKTKEEKRRKKGRKKGR